MKLSELLEHLAADYLDDRSEMLEGDPDSLWSDKLLVRWLNRAQDILCRRSWVIIDKDHAQAGTIVLKTGVATYPIHKSVLRVLSVIPEGSVSSLSNFDDALLTNPRPYTDTWEYATTQPAATGAPMGYSTETGTRLLRVYPTPTATENGTKLLMRVARMPVCYLDVSKLDAEPEVPAEYHLALCDYAAGKALTQPTVDSADKATGRALKEEFMQLVGEARQDRQRASMNRASWGFSSLTAWK